VQALWRKWKFYTKHTGLQTEALAQVLDSLLATKNALALDTAGLHLGGTLRKAARMERRIIHE
jgi:hypothetical protein